MSNIIRVAKAAGVSTMTVSRYFNQPELLAPPTRARVQAAVEALRYVPNAAARSLINGRSDALALILVDITNPFFTTLARGVEDAAKEKGYTLILGNTDETLEKERGYLEVMISRRVDGVILTPAPGEEHNLALLEQHKVPAVLVDREVPGSKCDIVRGDSFSGGYKLTSHLIAEGHRDIAFIGGPKGVSSLEARLAGYHKAMREAKLKPQVHLGRYDKSSGEEIVQRLYGNTRQGQPRQLQPEALVAANNLVAVGALVALRRCGLGVPQDVALASFDDLEMAALIDPFLTVVAQPAYKMGELATQLLLERIEGFSGPAREHILPVELVVRRSSLRLG